MRAPRAVLVLSLLGLLAPGAAQAQQLTNQGSPLTSPANYPYGCETRWSPGYGGQPGAFGPGGTQEYTAQSFGPSSCSLWQLGPRGATSQTHLVPGSGTITQARVKAGPNPAPVSIATIRQYTGRDSYGQVQTTCCRGISVTPQVTLTPNAITTIPVNLKVLAKPYDPNKPNEAGYYDIVAVNVPQGPGTLPLSDLGSPKPLQAPDSDPFAMWYFPAIAPDENNANQWFASNFEVLMNYDWCAAAGARASTRQACPTQGAPMTPTGPATPTTPTGPTTPTAPGDASKLVQVRGAEVGGKQVFVDVRCLQDAACAGTLKLSTAGKKPKLLASKAVSVPGGRTATIKLGLTAKERKLIGPRGLKVVAEVDLGAAGQVTKKLKLKA